MSIKIKAAIRRSEQVATSGDTIFALLKPVEESTRFFPRVSRIEPLGGERFRWALEPMGTQKYRHQVEYASQWEFDEQQRTIRWRPLEHEGNAKIAGVWSIQSGADSSRIALEIKAELKLDLPRWMQLVAEPIVQTEFQSLLNRYFDNVVKHCRTLS